MSTLLWLAVAVALPVGLFGFGRLLAGGAAEVQSQDDGPGAVGLRYPIYLACAVALVGSYWAVDDVTRSLFGSVSVLETLIFLVLFVVAATVTVRAVDWGFSLGEREVAVGPSPTRRFLVTAGLVVVVGVVLAVGRLVGNAVDPTWAVAYGVLLPACLLLWAVGRGYLIHPARVVRQLPVMGTRPTEAQRARLAACTDALDVSLEDIYIRERGWTIGHARGVGEGDAHRLMVSPELFEVVDDDEALAALLLQAEGRGYARYERLAFLYSFLRFFASAQLVLVLILGIGGLLFLEVTLGFAGALVLALGLCLLSLTLAAVVRQLAKRADLRGDTYASERLGPDALCHAYERYGDELATSRTPLRALSTRLDSVLHAEPSVPARLRRLEG